MLECKKARHYLRRAFFVLRYQQYGAHRYIFYSFTKVFGIVYNNIWIISPFILGLMAWKLWVYYINSEFLRKMKWVLLEIKLPKEIHRSPLAMELALASFHQTGGTSQWSDKYWKGQVRNYFSLEIVSIGGNIHFLYAPSPDFVTVLNHTFTRSTRKRKLWKFPTMSRV